MHDNFRFRKKFFIFFFYSLLSLLVFHGEFAHADSAEDILAVVKNQYNEAEDEGYVINFTDVSITEYIRFVSKILGINFIFDEAELQFRTTIVSEESISGKNVLSALIQVLRIHELNLIEQDHNLLITSNKTVNEIAHVVADDIPGSTDTKAPLITRIFLIKNTNAESIAEVIRPMLSSAAILEVMSPSNQLIVSDIVTSVDQIAELLLSLDSPHSPLEVDTYDCKNISPDNLILLAETILAPFKEGKVLTLVPQAETNSIFIVSTNALIERALSILEDLDSVSQMKVGKSLLPKDKVFIYKIVNQTPQYLLNSILQITEEMEQADHASPDLLESLSTVRWIKDSNSLMFIGNEKSITKTQEILTKLDSVKAKVEKKAVPKDRVFIYKIQKKSPEFLLKSIKQIAIEMEASDNASPELLQSLANVRWIKDSNSLMFLGNEETLAKVQDILGKIDSPTTGLGAPGFFLFPLKTANKDQVEYWLNQLADNLAETSSPDEGLIESIRTMKWIKETNSLLFNGNEYALARLKELLSSYDFSKQVTPESPNFWVYHPKLRSGGVIEEHVNEVTANLKDSGLTNTSLLNALESMRWSPASNTLTFTGNEASLSRIKTIVEDYDKTEKTGTPGFFLFPLKTANKDQVEYWLNQLADNLAETPSPDEGLIKSIRTMKWIKETNSLLFNGNKNALTRLKELLPSYDFSKKVTPESPNFWVYHPKLRSGEIIEEHVNEVTANLKDSGLTNTSLLNALESMRWSPASNTLTFTGDEASLSRIKTIVEDYDKTGKIDAITDKESMLAQQSTAFFIYKPKVKTPTEIMNSLTEIAQDLKESQFADPMFMKTLANIHYVESTKSLLFTGSEDSLERVRSLIERFDVPKEDLTSIQQFGAETFLIYKVEFVTPNQLLASLNTIAQDLEKSEKVDKSFIDTIHSAQWVQETNSLLFIGPEKVLLKVESLAKRFDIPSLSKDKPDGGIVERETPSEYILYVPKYQSGPELILMLTDFKAHLVQIGIVDKSLFDTISHLKWVEKSHAILVSGTQKSIAKVEELLERFDEPVKTEGVPTTIQTLETTSFLVYKLQYHHGSSIQEALKKISKELKGKDDTANKSILDAISSLQWISVTNSLVGTGHHHALEKLKELIRNLDTPLKQVFFEVLVIETSLTNAQDFGLQWGSKFQYLNKFAGATGNIPPGSTTGPVSGTIGPESNGTSRLNPFNMDKMAAKSKSTTGQPSSLAITPLAKDVPFAPSGFDLGIIGDILLHKGRSFISLGSLVSALQTDSDTTIVLNPKIITQDNNNSTLFVGQNIPFVGSQVSNTTTSTLVTTNLEYRDIGFNLSITPTLSTSEVVTIDINTDISVQVGSAQQLGDSGVEGITTSHTSMNTRVTVPNRHFLILTGMFRDDKEHSRAQIPCLGGLPLIGAAFSQNVRGDSKSNIVIFIKPYIINSFEEYKTITENQEVLLKEEAGLPVMTEEIDAGLEWVKTPEDD